jgi:hypothetical protein
VTSETLLVAGGIVSLITLVINVTNFVLKLIKDGKEEADTKLNAERERAERAERRIEVESARADAAERRLEAYLDGRRQRRGEHD